MNETVVIVLLALAAAGFVVTPIRRTETTTPADPAAELEERKLVALRAILDLEAEFEVGKLSQTDLDELRSVYEAEAVELIHRLDGTAAGTADPLEREIAAVRSRLAASNRCPSCGAARGRSQRCPSCGT